MRSQLATIDAGLVKRQLEVGEDEEDATSVSASFPDGGPGSEVLTLKTSSCPHAPTLSSPMISLNKEKELFYS
jgi:hypothetical protein